MGFKNVTFSKWIASKSICMIFSHEILISQIFNYSSNIITDVFYSAASLQDKMVKVGIFFKFW